jgi:hypothetical protein
MSLSRSATTVTQDAPDATRPAAAIEPAPAFLVLEAPRLTPRLEPAVADQDLAMHQPQQRAALGIHRDRRVRLDRVFRAIIAQARGVLDRQNVPPRHPPFGSRTGLGEDLLGAHFRIAQKSRQANLAGPLAPERAHRDTALTDLHQTPMEKCPPFSSLRSPNRPSPYSILITSLQITSPQRVRPAKQKQDLFQKRCVNAIGTSPGVTERVVIRNNPEAL